MIEDNVESHKKLILKAVLAQSNLTKEAVPLRNICIVFEVNGITDVDYINSLIDELVEDGSLKLVDEDCYLLPFS